MVQLSMHLRVVYTSLFLVCVTQARLPHCDNCALTFSSGLDFEDDNFKSPEPSYDIRGGPVILANAPDDKYPQLAPIPSPHYPRGDYGPLAGVFDVTDYGAIADGTTESSSAFLSAWEEACSSNGNSTLLVPDGIFFLGPVSFDGPCRNNLSPTIEIRGTLKAPPSLQAFKTDTWILFRNLRSLRLTGGTEIAILNAQGSLAWLHDKCHDKFQCKHAPRSLKFVNVSHGVINKIAVINSKGFHFSFLQCEHMNIHDLNISSPWNSPNTDGVHISYSTNITIQSSTIGVGDDCVSVGPGNTNISVFNVTCGPGHGISIGSLGKYKNEKDVNGVSVKNCTIKNTSNGVRIKTWPDSSPSKASNLTFEDILMVNVTNPIFVDQEYCPGNSCKSSRPSLVKLSNVSFKNINGTSNSKFATILHCSTIAPCENMKLIGIYFNYTSSGRKTELAALTVKGTIHGFHIFGSKFSTG